MLKVPGVTLELTSSLLFSQLENVEQKHCGPREVRKTDGDQIANGLLISPSHSNIFHENMMVTIRSIWYIKKLL